MGRRSITERAVCREAVGQRGEVVPCAGRQEQCTSATTAPSRTSIRSFSPTSAVAYWLDYVARQLELYADCAERPVLWMEQNVSAVLAAALARRRSGA